MQIKYTNPPNFDDIVAVFPDASRPGVIFTYGDTIYNPSKIDISFMLQDHEAVHSRRQGSNVVRWWQKYLADLEFRLAEEIPAHAAEYKTFKAYYQNKGTRREYLDAVAQRLSGPLYGNMISYRRAIMEIDK